MNAQVKSAANKVVAELCAWSLQFATSGVGPLVGFEGEPFKKNSWRYKLAGKPI